MQQRDRLIVGTGVVGLLAVAIYVGVQGGLFNKSGDLSMGRRTQPTEFVPVESVFFDASGHIIPKEDEGEPEEEIGTGPGNPFTGALAAVCDDQTFAYDGGVILIEKQIGPVPFKEVDARAEAMVLVEGKVAACSPSLEPETAFTCRMGCQKDGPDDVTVTAHPSPLKLLRAEAPRPGFMLYTYGVQAKCKRVRHCEAVPK